MRPDWQNAFGKPPVQFERSVAESVRDLEEKKMKKLGVRGLLIAALVAVLIAGTALAVTRSWGVLDFQNRSVATLPEAEGLVEDLTKEMPVSSPQVKYQLQDAVLSGKSIKLTVIAEPADPDKYILSDDWGGYQNTMPGTDKTCGQVAKETGRTVVSTGFADLTVNGIVASNARYDQVMEEDRVITYVYEDNLKGDLSGEVRVECGFYDHAVYDSREVQENLDDRNSAEIGIRLEEDWGEDYDTVLSFSIKADATQEETVRFKGPFSCEYMDIQWVEMTRTPVATVLTVRYTMHEDLTREQQDQLLYMSIHWVDGSDDQTFRAESGGSVDAVDSSGWDDSGDVFYYDEDGESHFILQGKSYVEWTEYGAISAFPDVIYLRPYYKEMGKWGKAIELSLNDRIMEGDEAASYYMTNAGKYYHTQSDCSGMEDAKQVPLSEAELAGKILCPICGGD